MRSRLKSVGGFEKQKKSVRKVARKAWDWRRSETWPLPVLLSAAYHVTYLSADFSADALAATSCSVLITNATLPNNPIVYVNAAFGALYGYDVTEVVGRNCRILQGPDSDPDVRAEMRAAIAAGKGIRREILNYRKDGTSFWNDVTIDPIRDQAGRLMGFVGIQYQADEAHRANEERADATSLLANITDHISGYVYKRVMRTDGSIEVVYCSSSVFKLLGISQTDVALKFYDIVHPDDRDALLTAIRNSAANMSIFREEFRLVAADGIAHWMRSDARPRSVANGEIVWDGLAIEISAEKRWESEIAS